MNEQYTEWRLGKGYQKLNSNATYAAIRKIQDVTDYAFKKLTFQASSLGILFLSYVDVQ